MTSVSITPKRTRTHITRMPDMTSIRTVSRRSSSYVVRLRRYVARLKALKPKGLEASRPTRVSPPTISIHCIYIYIYIYIERERERERGGEGTFSGQVFTLSESGEKVGSVPEGGVEHLKQVRSNHAVLCAILVRKR